MDTDPMAGPPVPGIRDHILARRSKLPADVASKLSPRPWGLALSGGGIRSATFCFGLLKSLARKQLFHRFDLLSTVSGGGYIGATVGKLYQNEVTPGAQGTADPMGVERALGEAQTRWFASWLRANGRYLIPRGAKDALFAGANFGRNLLGVHVELAFLSLLLGGLLVGLDLLVWQGADCVFQQRRCTGPGWLDTELLAWFSRWPTLWMGMPLVAWVGAVLACGYWALPNRKERPLDTQRLATAALALLGCLLLLRHGTTLLDGLMPRLTGNLELPGELVFALLALMSAWFVGIAVAVGLSGIPGRTLDWARNRLTAALSTALSAGLLLMGLGVIDYLAWSLGTMDGANQGSFGVAVLLVAVALRAALPKVADLPKSLTPTTRGVVMGVINLAGVVLLILVMVFWVALVHRATSGALFAQKPAELQFGPAWQWWAWLVLPPLLLVGVSAGNREFLNRSSLYTFYRARLVRSYLGAANSMRFRHHGADPTTCLSPTRGGQAPLAVADVHPDDDLPMADYAPHRAGGPVHLINACINQTRDPKGGAFNQDRKGLLLTVGPNGQMATHNGDWQQPGSAACLTLGSWMAISGAAIAPGLGASTRSGVAAILMLAGLRLGFWWDSLGLGRAGSRPQAPVGKYAQFLSELRGRFDGDQRRDWFLSDGGHFENTAAYALLREECELIVVADCGADPRYSFGDLENLVRKARIDLQADITFLRPREPDLRLPISFGSLNELASTDSQACLALARIDYRHSQTKGYMVIVKPNMCHGVPVDLVNFKADNPLFPQEPTTDQFFSEAQWESYFQLGQTLGDNLGLEQLQDARQFAEAFFVDDDGAILVKDEAGHQALRFSSKRLSSRVASTGAVSASVSLGAVTSIGLAAWQAVHSELASKSQAARIEPAVFKELTDIFGKLAAPAASASAPEDSRLGEMATALLRIGDAACSPSNVEAFRQSNLMRLMLTRTKQACRQSASPHPSCDDLLDDFKVSACLQDRPRTACLPQYWTRDYASATLQSANCWTPRLTPAAAPQAPVPVPAVVPAPPPPAKLAQPGGQAASGLATAPVTAPASAAAMAPAASSPTVPTVIAKPGARGVCDGHTVYLQIYGPELRDQVGSYRDPWRELGASVPPVEDVVDSARRAGRRAPQPYPVPTLIYYDDAARPCVDRLQPAGAWPAWKAAKLAGGSASQQRVIEAWVPPPARSAEGSQDGWLQELLPALGAGSAPTRTAALEQLIKTYAASPAAVNAAVWQLEPPRLEALSAAGRINVLTFLRNTQRGAWTPQLITRAERAVVAIRGRAALGVQIGPQTDEALNRLSAHLAAMKG